MGGRPCILDLRVTVGTIVGCWRRATTWTQCWPRASTLNATTSATRWLTPRGAARSRKSRSVRVEAPDRASNYEPVPVSARIPENPVFIGLGQSPNGPEKVRKWLAEAETAGSTERRCDSPALRLAPPSPCPSPAPSTLRASRVPTDDRSFCTTGQPSDWQRGDHRSTYLRSTVKNGTIAVRPFQPCPPKPVLGSLEDPVRFSPIPTQSNVRFPTRVSVSDRHPECPALKFSLMVDSGCPPRLLLPGNLLSDWLSGPCHVAAGSFSSCRYYVL